LAILTCPGCGRGGLRIPDGRRGKVTCPRCGAEWFYPETIELDEIEFRCSQTGARFIIQLARRSPLHKFVVQAVKNAPPQPRQRVKHSKEEHPGPASSTSALESQNAGLARLGGPKPGRWLARVFGKIGAPATSSPRGIGERVPATPASKSLSYDAGEYNWASFFCPYCKASNFIKCGAGHLVCDGTVETRNGRRFHQCFCGNTGFVEGTIKSFEGTRRTFEQTDVVSTKPTSAASAVKNKPSVSALEPPAKKSETPLLR
jgi:hypothetical protein